MINETQNAYSFDPYQKVEVYNYILTILAIAILEKKYLSDASEWKLIKHKAVKWCKKTRENLIGDKSSDIEDYIKNLI